MDGIRDVLPSPGEARGSDFATSARTIGVVIRTLDESALIGRCLETLRRQRGGFDLDVVVVDSGSTDLTLEIARSHDARIVELSPDDFDYSRALNVGIEESRGELVVSLSAHAIPVDDDWLTKMTSPFAEPRVAGVTSRQVPWPDAPWQEVHRLGRQFLDQGCVYATQGDPSIVFSNAASAFRRSAWRDEPFTLPAAEDLEWAQRVIGEGWLIVYEAGAAVYHSHHENPRAQALRMIDINRVLDADAASRPRRRTVLEAAGMLVRDARKILGLDEPLWRKLRYLGDLLLMVSYYVVDFTRAGTTAERRGAGTRSESETRRSS